jgi:hypothetical protein
MTDTAPEVRGGFPEVRPVEDAPPELGRFVAALHRLQDLTVSTRPDGELWAVAAEHVENACALLGMVVTTAEIRPTRTAYLRVDYRKITPIEEPLTAHGRISEIDGRKVFISATMTSADGTLLSEANGLMVRLLPHQP